MRMPQTTVRLSRPLRFRLWLALQLTRVVGWLVNGRVDIKEADDGE